MIDLNLLLEESEEGFINRLKLQKYIYLAQTSLNNNFGYEFSIYRNGPYSPGLANYYYEELDFNRIPYLVEMDEWNNDEKFTKRFLTLFDGKEPGWLEVASTLIDSTFYFESEQESLDNVYAIKSRYGRDYINRVWDELKHKDLVNYPVNAS